MSMTLKRCSIRRRRIVWQTFAIWAIFFFFAGQTVYPATWDRKGAQKALQDARQLREQILTEKEPARDLYLRCIRTYQLVYRKDPHFGGSDDAIFEAGDLYQQMGDKFAATEYYKEAARFFGFLVSDYGGSPFSPSALLRIGDLNAGPLGNEAAAENAYRLLRTRYRSSKEAKQLAARAGSIRRSVPPAAETESKPKEPVRAQAAEKRAESKEIAAPSPDAIQVKPGDSEPIPVAGNQPAAEVKKTKMAEVLNIRHWSTDNYTRIIIDVDAETRFKRTRLANPDRIFFDIENAKLSSELLNKVLAVEDVFLKRVRVAQNRADIVRVVLDFATISDYTVFELHDPYRIIVDIQGVKAAGKVHPAVETAAHAVDTAERPAAQKPLSAAAKPPDQVAKPAPRVESFQAPEQSGQSVRKNQDSKEKADVEAKSTEVAVAGAMKSAREKAPAIQKPEVPPTAPEEAKVSAPAIKDAKEKNPPSQIPIKNPAISEQAKLPVPGPTETKERAAGEGKPKEPNAAAEVRAAREKTQMAAKQVEPEAIAEQKLTKEQPRVEKMVGENAPAAESKISMPTAISSGPAKPSPAKTAASEKGQPISPIETIAPPKVAAPTSTGSRTLTRMLGLKIGRIVLDPGHGGHDTGTIGRTGLKEKDLVLQVAIQLKKMLEENLGAEVYLTRENDKFIPLEERTAMANQHNADLFVSIHANASGNRTTSGIETYFLDFARTAAEREVAARENASTVRNIRDLQNLITKIAKAEKSAESRELASIIQKKMVTDLQLIFPAARNRGVRSAPFVVLIGANMPSVLTEVGFISNPRDERLLRKEDNQQRLAKALFLGIDGYMKTLASDVAQSHSN